MKRKFKLLALCLSVVFLVNCFAINLVNAQPSEWAKNEVELAESLGLFTDDIRDNFQENITREVFCILVVNMLEEYFGQEVEVTVNNPFEDTDNIEVIKAYQLGIVNGRNATQFDPNANIQRQAMSTMLIRAANKMSVFSMKTISTPSGDLNQFLDAYLIQDWARDSMAKCLGCNVINGVGGNLISPEGNATIEQSILMLLRIYILFNMDAYMKYQDIMGMDNEANNQQDDNGACVDSNTSGSNVTEGQPEQKTTDDYEQKEAPHWVFRAKFDDYEGHNDNGWWGSGEYKTIEKMRINSGEIYRPATVGEIRNHPGCNYIDYHTNLNPDDDAAGNVNEWALYDLVVGTNTGTESGDNFITAMDYVLSRAHDLPTKDELIELSSTITNLTFAGSEEWPNGFYWTGTPASEVGKQWAVNIFTGDAKELSVESDLYVASISRSELKESVTFYGQTFYKPLDVSQVSAFGADEEIRSANSSLTWALYDANDTKVDGLTAETIAYDLGLRLPTTTELLMLQRSFPGGTIRSMLGWPTDNRYWCLNGEGTPVAVKMGNGEELVASRESIRNLKCYVVLVKDVEMENQINLSRSAALLCPQRVNELPQGVEPFDTFVWMGETYPLFSILEDAEGYYKYVDYMKSIGLRQPTEEEMIALFDDYPGLYPGSFLPEIYGWPAGTNGISPIGYYASESPIHALLFSTVTGKYHLKPVLFGGIEFKQVGLVIFVKE